MHQDIWNKNQLAFTKQTGLSVKDNEGIYIKWIIAVFTIEIYEQQKTQMILLTQILDFKK